MTLAVDDDELKAETITSLAKSGDPQLERFFELYRQGSVYNWPDQEGGVRIVVNEETEMDDDFMVPFLKKLHYYYQPNHHGNLQAFQRRNCDGSQVYGCCRR